LKKKKKDVRGIGKKRKEERKRVKI